MNAPFDEARISDGAEEIAAGFRPLIEHHPDSLVQSFLKKSGAYSNGLTNGESRLALVRALALLQAEVVADFARLIWTDEEA